MQHPEEAVKDGQSKHETDKHDWNSQSQIIPIQYRIDVRETVLIPAIRRPKYEAESYITHEQDKRVIKVKQTARSLRQKDIHDGHNRVESMD